MREKAETGPIQKDTVYPQDNLMRRLGWGDYAMRSARRSGLKVIRTGKSIFIRGEDFIEWLNKQAEQSAAASSN